MEEIKNKFWAIGGGKGGVGKSIVTLMLGASLARQNKKVILVDADLGGSNLHTLAGIKYPLCTLADFISRQVEKIEDVLIDTPVENMKLICGADDILGIANPKSTQKIRILNHLNRLEADFVFLDLGAGTSFTAMDFFLYAPNKIVVLTPQITSVQNAYGFIKASLYRMLNSAFRKDQKGLELIKRAASTVGGEHIDTVEKLKEAFKSLDTDQQVRLQKCLEELNVKVIVNMVRMDREKNVDNIVKTVAWNYLGLSLESLGVVQYDKILGMSINNMPEFLAKKKDSISSMNFYDIAGSIIKNYWRPDGIGNADPYKASGQPENDDATESATMADNIENAEKIPSE
jgi:flagellar biosynthesis protein FlhG